MKNILVTGGAGFIGSNFIIKQINETENIIINYDKLTYAGNLENLDEVENNTRYKFINGDICDQKRIKAIIERFKPNVIINFAAESHVDRSIDGPDQFIETNIVGTYIILNQALKYYEKIKSNKDFRFIHISTDEVFG
ncbi:MAG: GDP-mannose 4,6-dehydratase, partial [Candidatus Cloacimonetes bacterium]|nr:GDP-mannose 4,6-dehydratase [Candidatus Cloacimonadota bacterium]